MSDVDFSMVIPVYYNEGCLVPFMESLDRVVLQANPNYVAEIIFIDDGSGDGSFAELQLIQSRYPGVVTIIKLTRNFGQIGATLAGYDRSRGRCVITMSADGQDPPELINDMLREFFEENHEVVICARAGRDESIYRNLTSRLFYYVMRRLTFKNMPTGGFDVWLLGRRALQAFMRNSDAHPLLQGRVLWMGFNPKFLFYRRQKRLAGTSRWTFGKKFTVLLDGVMAYSFAPIRIISLVGCTFSLLGFVYAGLILVDSLMLGNPVKGWAPQMIVLLVIGGFQMIMLGMIGEYLWRTLAQVRGRDPYLIDAIYEAGDAAARLDSTRERADMESAPWGPRERPR
jgi:glycosyltransferase involved in cell wall biosynthesis